MSGEAGGDPTRFAPRRKAADALPACLGELSHPPAGLWYLGDAALLDGAPHRHVAIVGTRDSSVYGERTARELARACSQAGLVVVSGLARGIDAAAHRAALESGGSTIAILGTGVDVPYPAGHRALHRQIAEQGLVLSEFEPGTLAGPGCFPRRNRLIGALARVTLVVEAGFKSGAINTATQALELGREIAAVPGPIDAERSSGANLLCRDGAHVITCVEDLLGLFDLSTVAVSGAPTWRGGPDEASPAGSPEDQVDFVSIRQYAERELASELQRSSRTDRGRAAGG